MKKLFYLILAVPLLCSAQKNSKITITELKYGLYTAWTTSETTNDQSITGVTSGLSNIILNEKTDTVPFNQEIWFGVNYVINAPGLETVDIEVVWIYPRPITNESGKEWIDLHNKSKKEVGNDYFTGYQMSEKYELVPGKWTLQIWVKKKMLLEHFFYVKEATE